nr:RHS repeat-associated core domain-containing protein [Litoribacter ruber]
MAIYQTDSLTEQSIYGSSRLGIHISSSQQGYRSLGGKNYELSNHLGNVLAVVSDNIHLSQDSTWTQVSSLTDYYPFGLAMEGRTYQDTTLYRYGFNGMERDDEWKGKGNTDTTEFRQYDARVGRWMSVDPLGDHPSQIGMSPYSAYWNNPIYYVDPTGLCPDCGGIEDPYEGQVYTSTGGMDYHYSEGQWTGDGGSLEGVTVTAPRRFDGVLGRAADSWLTNQKDYSTFGKKGREGLGGETEWWSDTKQAIGVGYGAITNTMLATFQGAQMSAEFATSVGGKVGVNSTRGVGLSSDIAKTFAKGRYQKIVLDKPMTLSRYYDNVGAFAKGRYMANPSSITGNRFIDRMGLALRPKWNEMTKVAHWNLPKGTTVYKGKAAMQFPWIGGRTQYFVPNLNNINRVIRP